MRHPFEGIEPCEVSKRSTTRRSFFTGLLGLAGGLFGLTALAEAQQPNRQQNSGQSNTQHGQNHGSRGGGRYTTYAVGEEGGYHGPPRQWYATRAWWEDGGHYTTQALGEEGGRYTTYALGEEGGWYQRPRPGVGYTTYALGEEG